MRHVVHDADAEVAAGRIPRELVEHGLDHGRRELLARKPVATADDARQLGFPALGEGRHYIQIQRLADGPRLLGAVEHRYRAHAARQRVEERRHRKRPIQPHLHEPHALAFRGQVLHGLARRLGAGAHQHHDPFGILVAEVVEQVIAPAGATGKALHLLLDDARRTPVVQVHRFTRLEERVRVLGGATYDGVIRRQTARAMRFDQLVVDHEAQVVVFEPLDLRQLVRSAEAVEEMQERNPRT